MDYFHSQHFLRKVIWHLCVSLFPLLFSCSSVTWLKNGQLKHNMVNIGMIEKAKRQDIITCKEREHHIAFSLVFYKDCDHCGGWVHPHTLCSVWATKLHLVSLLVSCVLKGSENILLGVVHFTNTTFIKRNFVTSWIEFYYVKEQEKSFGYFRHCFNASFLSSHLAYEVARYRCCVLLSRKLCNFCFLS